ncbi:MAG: glycerol-3-phosphate 1-O-acyltransferase PlsY [Clostridiales bacterium]|nr:glycerol-3-phosphate 1-O-acyltransferase PlsY [Clostridiales bacterium]
MFTNIIICLLIGYLFGCFSTGYVIGKINKVDITKYGSKSSGTTNALRTLGAKAGLYTLLGDVIKAIIPVLLVKLIIFPDLEYVLLLALYTGLGVVLGHNYPVFLKFKGGKGIASTGGTMLAFDPLIVVFALPIFAISVAITKYVSIGSLLISMFFPIWVIIRNPGNIHMLLVACVFTLLAFIKHKDNIKRLLKGTENKLGQRVKIEHQE